MKITSRYGAEAVEQLNDVLLLAQAAEAKLVRCRELRTRHTRIKSEHLVPHGYCHRWR